MKKKILFLSIALIASVTLFAQKQKTIYYDKDWKVCSRSKAEFYRIVNYDKKRNPVGKIMDYYITGELHTEIDGALYIDKYYNSKSRFIGFAEGFYRSGAKQFETLYDNQGNIVTRKRWYENGQLRQKVSFKNGQFDGQLLTYWENGNAKRIDEYNNGELITGKCFNIDGEEIDYFDYEVMPNFPGGEQGLLQYISNEIRYPYRSQKNNIEGSVLMVFAVDIDGSISDIQILERVNPEIDIEAIRVVKQLPKFLPGKEDGELVKVYYTLPINFRLSLR